MRKVALTTLAALIAAAVAASPAMAAKKKAKAKAPAAAQTDPNANSRKFVGAWVGQVIVPAQSMTKPAAPAKKGKKK